MKKLYAVLTGIAVTAFMSLALAGPASAADETATVGLEMTPQSGQLSKTERKAVNWRVEVEIKAPFPASPKVQPMKRVRTTFPSDMAFVPKSGTPVCPDDQVGPEVNLSFPPDTIIARCPDAVLGNGTAGLYLAQANSANGPNLKDPVLIVFNGGETNTGLPRIKIYGYSAGTGAGVYMDGTLDNGVLDVQIPVLSFDSGTGDFNLNIPGSSAAEENRRGVDSSYVQAKCSTGTWLTSAEFTLGTRDSGGTPTSPDDIIQAPESSGPCTGVVTAKGKISKVTVKGPSKVKKGKSSTYKVAIKNTGKGDATGVRLKASGKGISVNSPVGKIGPGKTRTVNLKVKPKKTGKVKATFKVTSNNAGGKTVKKTIKVVK